MAKDTFAQGHIVLDDGDPDSPDVSGTPFPVMTRTPMTVPAFLEELIYVMAGEGDFKGYPAEVFNERVTRVLVDNGMLPVVEEAASTAGG